MIIALNGTPHELPEGTMLFEALRALSPYGGEPVIALVNGLRADEGFQEVLKDGDDIAVFPLLIGG